MKIRVKLPQNAKSNESHIVIGRTVVRIPKMTGWDIANAIARENGRDISSFAEVCDLGVYCDHVMLDTKYIVKS